MKKLVRDRIPEIIKNNGRVPYFYVALDAEYKRCLHEKLIEESNELISSSKIEDVKAEIADVLEVLDGIMKVHGLSHADVMEIKNTKKAQRGGFDNKYVLDMSKTV